MTREEFLAILADEGIGPEDAQKIWAGRPAKIDAATMAEKLVRESARVWLLWRKDINSEDGLEEAAQL